MSVTEGSATEAQLAPVVKSSRAAVEKVVTQLGPYVELLEKHGYGEKYCEELRACMKEAQGAEPATKDQLGETNLRVTKLGQAIFKEVAVLLAKVKEIKKRCSAADKAKFEAWKAE